MTASPNTPDHPPVTAPSVASEVPGPSAASRRQRLLAGLDALAAPDRDDAATSRTMLVAAMLAGVGLAVVMVGWFGASRTPNLHEQIPYLISGGLFGLGLVFLGGSAYYAHWVATVVREQRAQTAELVRAVTELGDRLAVGGAGGGADGSSS